MKILTGLGVFMALIYLLAFASFWSFVGWLMYLVVEHFTS